MLKFLGCGSAFNTTLGNTSAYIKKDKSLLLIDCGGTVFSTLRERNLLEGIDNLHIFITHTHPDHVGSLGDLIFYCKHMLRITPTIYFPHFDILQSFFTAIGIKEDLYVERSAWSVTINDAALGEIHALFNGIKHTKKIPACCILFKVDEKRIYYSGDSREIFPDTIDMLKEGFIDFLYQDTCGMDYKGNVHMSISRLESLIPVELRNKVYCIHHDESLDLQRVVNLGFQVPGEVKLP